MRTLSRHPGQTPHLKTLHLTILAKTPFPDELTFVGMRTWAYLPGLPILSYRERGEQNSLSPYHPGQSHLLKMGGQFDGVKKDLLF